MRAAYGLALLACASLILGCGGNQGTPIENDPAKQAEYFEKQKNMQMEAMKNMQKGGPYGKSAGQMPMPGKPGGAPPSGS